MVLRKIFKKIKIIKKNTTLSQESKFLIYKYIFKS
jgi:hypothetical protein